MNQKRNFKWMSLMLMLMAGLFTCSLTSCDDDEDDDYSNSELISTPSALRHTWQVQTSTNGDFPLSGVDDVIIDLSSGNTMRFIVLLTSNVAAATGASSSTYYLLSDYTFNFKTYSRNGGSKGTLTTTNANFPYELVTGGLNLTIGNETYGLTQCTLPSINPLVPDAVYNYVQ